MRCTCYVFKFKKPAARVQAVLDEFGYELNVTEFRESTRTAQKRQMP